MSMCICAECDGGPWHIGGTQLKGKKGKKEEKITTKTRKMSTINLESQRQRNSTKKMYRFNITTKFELIW